MLHPGFRAFCTVLLKARNRVFNLFDPPVVVLIYHRVTTLPIDPQLLAVSPENFRAHVRFLKGNFPVLRFEDDWAGLKEPAVVITFDDGYADNVIEALPILEEERVPATFFVSTGGIGDGKEFWWDELERIILGDWHFQRDFECRVGGFHKAWRTSTVEERNALYREIHPLIKKLGAANRGILLEDLRKWAGAGALGRETHRPMNADELRRLAASEFATVGAHTVTHTRLAALPAQEQRQEIFESKRVLEEITGKEATVFSYPFGGKKDYTSQSVSFCREAGFVKVAANFSGQAHRWTDAFQLPRQLVRNWDVTLFAEMLTGFFTS